MTKDNVFLYHYPCADGFGAYHIFYNTLLPDDRENWEFIPINYSDPVPDVRNKHVLMVDFSFKPEVLDEMVKVAKSITILDHHKTALDALYRWTDKLMGRADKPSPHPSTSFRCTTAARKPDTTGSVAYDYCTIEVVFDLSKSGVRLMWEYVLPQLPMPSFYAYVEDRDLWKWALVNSREVNAALRTYPLTLSAWDELRDEMYTKGIDRFVSEGDAVLRAQDEIIRQSIESTMRTIRIGKYIVPVINIPGILASEAGHVLCQGQPFSASYYDHANGKRVWSLRSTYPHHGAVAVNVIAESFGGGGHPPAAGFSTDTSWFGE